MQAVGLVVGRSSDRADLFGVSDPLAWRILLVWGAAGRGVIYFRRNARVAPVHALVQGRADQAAKELHQFADGALDASTVSDDGKHLMGIRQFLAIRDCSDARGTRLLVLFDYAYYGNTLSLPSILSEVSRMRASS